MAAQTVHMPPPRQDSVPYRQTPSPVSAGGNGNTPGGGGGANYPSRRDSSQQQQQQQQPSRQYSGQYASSSNGNANTNTNPNSNSNSPARGASYSAQSSGGYPSSYTSPGGTTSASQAYASQIQQTFSPVDIGNGPGIGGASSTLPHSTSGPILASQLPPTMVPIKETDQPSRQYAGAGGMRQHNSSSSLSAGQGTYAQTMSMYGGGQDFGQSMGQGYAGSVYGMSTMGGGGAGGTMVGRGQRGESMVGPSQPILDNSHLKPGASAALLSHDKTLELYRANAKKTNDPELMFEFAVFMIDAAKSIDPSLVTTPFSDPNSTTPINQSQTQSPVNPTNPHSTVPASQVAQQKRDDLIKEAISLLKRLADRGHPDAQYFLADCYANGIGTVRGKQDFDRAFPLFVLAAKHGHPDASYRAGTCCEHGWGCRRESSKAISFYKKAAAALHPGAMYRLGTAELNGSLGLVPRPKEGVKWLKRSGEHATAEFPHALHEMALLHERGIENVLFVDLEYASELLAQASELGYAPSAFKLGECYEYGKMGCPMDAALSIHYYNIAAQQDHRDGCFALTAWYLVGSPGVLPQSDTEAFLWAKKAAEMGLAKAQYAVGYFTEVGIGTPASPQNAIQWYKLASEQGDKRAEKRLRNFSASPTGSTGTGRTRGELLARGLEGGDGEGKGDKDGCIIM